jgi:enoyl-CoA hydratase
MSVLRLEGRGRIRILRLDKERGNAIDEPLAEELIRVTEELGTDESVHGVLLASAHATLFCPGLDLISLVEYDRASMERFIGKFARALWSLYGLRKPVVAAVAGHAVAGGCALALTADQRLLRRGGVQMGLAEVGVGVPLPWSVAVLLRATLAPGSISRVALLGRNFSDQEAVSVGLADELCEAEGFEEACLERLSRFADKDPKALGRTKSYLRASALAEMKAHEKDHVQGFLDGWFSEAARERLRRTVAALASRR